MFAPWLDTADHPNANAVAATVENLMAPSS
jgi:hypothetical protein